MSYNSFFLFFFFFFSKIFRDSQFFSNEDFSVWLFGKKLISLLFFLSFTMSSSSSSLAMMFGSTCSKLPRRANSPCCHRDLNEGSFLNVGAFGSGASGLPKPRFMGVLSTTDKAIEELDWELARSNFSTEVEL